MVTDLAAVPPPIMPVVDTADRLNHACFCIILDRQALMRQLDVEIKIPGFPAGLASSHPPLRSNVLVFVSEDSVTAMESVVAAVEAVAQLPNFQSTASAWAPAIAAKDFGPAGALRAMIFTSQPTALA